MVAMKSQQNLAISIFFSSMFLYTFQGVAEQRLFFEIHKEHNGYGGLNQGLLRSLNNVFNIDIFIETGTYNGSTTEQVLKVFNTIHTVEFGEQLYKEAKYKFRHKDNVTVYHDSSDRFLSSILPTLNGKIVFWLDAHYSGGITAMGEGTTPILGEIKAIQQSNIKDCIIMIDDVRVFGTSHEKQDFCCIDGYPSMQRCCQELLMINENFTFILIGDQLIAYDQSKYSIPVYPMV